MSLRTNRQEWEDLGDLDPLWAILSDPKRKFGKWDVDEFFLTGEQEIQSVMESAKQLGYPSGRELALDFGCGAGRLTRALTKYFQECYGVDISGSMLAKAKELNSSIPRCHFILNTEDNLKIFSDNYFDLIYTNVVLQHLPSKQMIKSYLAEFIRTLKKKGVLVFQLPSNLEVKNRIQPRRRLYALLRTLGLNKTFLYEKLKLCPMRINFIPEEEVLAVLKEIGAKVLDVTMDSTTASSIGRAASVQSRIYYVTK